MIQDVSAAFRVETKGTILSGRCRTGEHFRIRLRDDGRYAYSVCIGGALMISGSETTLTGACLAAEQLIKEPRV